MKNFNRRSNANGHHSSKRCKLAQHTLMWITRIHSHIYINTGTKTCEAPAQLLQNLESKFLFSRYSREGEQTGVPRATDRCNNTFVFYKMSYWQNRCPTPSRQTGISRRDQKVVPNNTVQQLPQSQGKANLMLRKKHFNCDLQQWHSDTRFIFSLVSYLLVRLSLSYRQRMPQICTVLSRRH